MRKDNINFIPDDSDSDEWAEYDRQLVEEYADHLRTLRFG